MSPAAHLRWDWLTRLSHWLLAAAFLSNYWLNEAGEDLHNWLGYLIAVLVLMRLVRGFTGPVNIRFADFLRSPAAILRDLRHPGQSHPAHLRRHSPAGGAMIMLLLAGLALTAVSGWLQTLDMFWGEDWPQVVHTLAANVTMGAVAMHISAVVLIQVWRRIPLIQRMFGG